jgi:nucleotide-binding universal stress UspA family protein
VVGIDGSAASIDALRHAARYAEALGATLEAINVWSYPPVFEAYAPEDWSPDNDAQEVLERAAEEAFGGTPPSRYRTSARRGSAARVLIDESKNADLIVVGSRGHGGFSGLLLGSVSAACARHAHCPVLIVRPVDKPHG